jgi:homoserine kinase type II
MLWESTEPRSALQERFGLAGFDEAGSWLTKVLAEAWAIDVQRCDRIIISGDNAIAWIRTNRGALVAKWSRAQDHFVRFAATADLVHALHRQGVPVAPPLASVDGQYRVIIGSLSMTVQPEVDGELLDTTDDTAVRRAGACLARLHSALATQRDSRLTESARHRGGSLDLRRRIGTWLQGLQHEDNGMAPAASARLCDQLASLPQIDNEPQLIHNDYRASNILTSGSGITAVLDFDEVALDYCVSASRTHSSCSVPDSPTGNRHLPVSATPFWMDTSQCDHSPASNTDGCTHSCCCVGSKPSRPAMTPPDGPGLFRAQRGSVHGKI